MKRIDFGGRRLLPDGPGKSVGERGRGRDESLARWPIGGSTGAARAPEQLEHDAVEQKNRKRGAKSGKQIHLADGRKWKGKLRPQVPEKREQRIAGRVSNAERGSYRRELSRVGESDGRIRSEKVDQQRNRCRCEAHEVRSRMQRLHLRYLHAFARVNSKS